MTATDTNLDRLEAVVARLERLGIAAPTLAPEPALVPGVTFPANVAPGELIESAWGNAVVTSLQQIDFYLANRFPYRIEAGKTAVNTNSSGQANMVLPVTAESYVSFAAVIDRPTAGFHIAAGRIPFVFAELSPNGLTIDMTFWGLVFATATVVPIASATMVIDWFASAAPVTAGTLPAGS